MKTGKKCLLALTLSLAMCLGMLCNSTIAADLEEATSTSVNEGSVLTESEEEADSTLSDDCTEDELLVEGYDDEDDEDYEDEKDRQEQYEKEQKEAQNQQQIEKLKAAVAAAEEYKGTVTGDIYSERIVLDRGLYTLEINITETDDGDVMKGEISPKADLADCGIGFRVDAVFWKGIGSEKTLKREEFDDRLKSGFTCTLDYDDFDIGCNYVRLKVVPYLDDADYLRNVNLAEVGLNKIWYEYVEVNIKNDSELDVIKVTSKEIRLLPREKIDNNVTEHGVWVWYRKKGTTKWQKKKFKGGQTIKLKKLSPNTTYQIKAQDYVKSVNIYGETETIWFNETEKISVRTALDKAPVVTSVKVLNFKESSLTSKGYYDDYGNWHKPETVWIASCDIKITFKNKPKGALGYIVENSGGKTAYKTGKNSITLKGIGGYGLSKFRGKKGTMKLYTYSCNDSTGKPTGFSPSVKKTFVFK